MGDGHACSDAGAISSLEGFEVFPHVVRLLARGEPVRVEELAAAAGRPASDIERLARSQPGTEWDEKGRLVGFGLTLRPTPHRLIVAGRTLYTWCAADTVMFTMILGEPSEVESTCPATGAPIRLELAPASVVSVSPLSAVISELPGAGLGGDLRAEVCDHGHFFASTGAASTWSAKHPDGEVLEVAEAFARYRDACKQLGWLADSPVWPMNLTRPRRIGAQVHAQLLHVPDCPLIGRLRSRLDRCIAMSGLDVEVEEIEGLYPSPTLLVDGTDITGRALDLVSSCRLDLPSEQQILAALDAACGC